MDNMNKYIMITISVILAIIVFNFGVRNACAEGIYAKGLIGLNNVKPIKNVKEELSSHIKQKDNFPVIAAGIGYEFANSWRVEGVFDYYFLIKQKEKSKCENVQYNVNLETKISDIMLNIYKGFELNEHFKPFIGGGIGVAHLKDSAKGYALEAIEDGESIFHKLDKEKGKSVLRTAYKLTAGVDYSFSENVTGELSYNYFTFGKNKPKIKAGIENITSRKFSVHNVSAGIRVNL